MLYNNILIDGGLCFTKELCDEILNMASKNCDRLIARVFDKKLDIMKIADFFPKNCFDFNIVPNSWHNRTGNDYTFYVWDFKKK